MSLQGLVAEVDGALSRAHGLFGNAPESGGAAAASAGDSVGRAADSTRGAGATTAGMSGRWVAGHGEFTGRHAPILDGASGNYYRLSGMLEAAAGADRAGHGETRNVLEAERGDTRAIAPTTSSPAGQKTLILALRRRVEEQKRVLAAYRARDAQLQAAVRSLTARQGMSGGQMGAPMGGGMGSGMGSGLGGQGMSGMSAGLAPISALAARQGEPGLVTRGAAARARQVPGGPGERAAAAALAERGTPYVWGAKGPSSFDCSGLTQYAWRQAGVQLGPDTYAQINQGVAVPAGQVRAGDLIFPHDGHVMLAISGTEVVHAPQSGDVVRVAPMPDSYVARRPVTA